MDTEETLWHWVRMRPRFKKINDMHYYFEYEGHMCYGIKTIFPDTEELRIMPHYGFADIGNGAGQSVFKSFKRINKNNLLPIVLQ